MNERDEELVSSMATFMGLEVIDCSHENGLTVVPSEIYHSDNDNWDYETVEGSYNPLTNGTQLNEFIEKARISIDSSETEDTWVASYPHINTGRALLKLHKKDKSRTKATRLCAAEFLGIKDYS